MRRWQALRQATVLGILSIVAVILVALVQPQVLDTALSLELGVLAVLGAWVAQQAMTRWFPMAVRDSFRAAIDRHREISGPPSELVEMTNAIRFSSVSSFDYHYRLRPLLQEVAKQRLTRHIIDLNVRPAAAEQLLGATAWSLLRPDRPPPKERQRRGIPLETIEATITVLEKL